MQDWKIRLEARKYRIWTLINIGLLLPVLLPLDEVEDGTVRGHTYMKLNFAMTELIYW